MENLGKKIGYLKGLLKALPGDQNTELLGGILELLEAATDRVETLDKFMQELNEYAESIDDDLSELEELVHDELASDDEDEDDDFWEDDDDSDTDADIVPMHDSDVRLSDEDDEEDDGDDADFEDDIVAGEDQLHLMPQYTVHACPKCGGIFLIEGAALPDVRYICPKCGEPVTPVPQTPENTPFAKQEL